jgi:anti-sigma factor RsiW
MTMLCESVRDQMHELVFDELDPDVRAQLVEHVTQCAECALEHARWSLDLAAIGPAWEVEPPERVAIALRDRVERAFVPWWGRALGMLRRPVPAYGVVAAFVIPLVLWSVARPPAPAAETAEPATIVVTPFAPEPDASTAAEVPPPRVVGYDARSIVPSAVF